MPKHLRLLETLRESSRGLKQIASVIDQAVLDIENIEEASNFGVRESEAVMAELGEAITEIKNNRTN